MNLRVVHTLTTCTFCVFAVFLAAGIIACKYGVDVAILENYVGMPMLVTCFAMLLGLGAEQDMRELQARATETARVERLRRFRGQDNP